MNYLEYLYLKYYCFQVRVGNNDIAPFSSILIIAFTIMLYYFSIFFLGILFISQGVLDMKLFKYLSISLFIFIIARLYYLFVYKMKYKVLQRKYEMEIKSRKNLGAILFPSVAFILFILGWILKMMQNQGLY